MGLYLLFKKSEGILHARLNIYSFKMESSLPWKRPNVGLLELVKHKQVCIYQFLKI